MEWLNVDDKLELFSLHNPEQSLHRLDPNSSNYEVLEAQLQ